MEKVLKVLHLLSKYPFFVVAVIMLGMIEQTFSELGYEDQYTAFLQIRSVRRVYSMRSLSSLLA